jgi:hypothetical protein
MSNVFKCFMRLLIAKKLSYSLIVDPAFSSIRRSLGPLGSSRDGSELAAIEPRSCIRLRIDA